MPVAVRSIVTYENPRLRMKSVKVKRIDRSIQNLIDDMIDTMRAAEGVGLAAPQIGVLLRVAVVEYVEEETEDLRQTVLINPEVLAKEGEWMAEEGCLSIPGYVGTVPRAERIVVRGRNRQGKDVRIKTDGRLAHILQHEIDHLDGILYIDYLESLDELRKVEPGTRKRRGQQTDAEDGAAGESSATSVAAERPAAPCPACGRASSADTDGASSSTPQRESSAPSPMGIG